MDALNNQSINKIHWNDSLVIGIPEVDEQHKILLDIFNELISIVLPIFRQGLTSINSEQERGGSRLGLTLFRPCT